MWFSDKCEVWHIWNIKWCKTKWCWLANVYSENKHFYKQHNAQTLKGVFYWPFRYSSLSLFIVFLLRNINKYIFILYTMYRLTLHQCFSLTEEIIHDANSNFCCYSSAFIFKAHHVSHLLLTMERGHIKPWFYSLNGDHNYNSTPKKLNYNWISWERLGFVDEHTIQSWKSMRILLYKLQNISIKLPFANKYDIILMTNWTATCLSGHDLLTV